MVEPVSTSVGGLIGALIGALWSEPFRNSVGQFTTRSTGFKNWIAQVILGGFLGAMATSAIVPILLANPGTGGLLVIGGAYLAYRKFIDPR